MRFLFCLFIILLINAKVFSCDLHNSHSSLIKSDTNDTSYILIGMLETDDQIINSVKLQIESVNSCKVIDFCKTHSIFIVKYNNLNNQNFYILFDQIQENVPSYTLYLKIGAVTEILNTCNTAPIGMFNDELNPTKAK